MLARSHKHVQDDLTDMIAALQDMLDLGIHLFLTATGAITMGRVFKKYNHSANSKKPTSTFKRIHAINTLNCIAKDRARTRADSSVRSNPVTCAVIFYSVSISMHGL
jgi:hypothetical protein